MNGSSMAKADASTEHLVYMAQRAEKPRKSISPQKKASSAHPFAMYYPQDHIIVNDFNKGNGDREKRNPSEQQFQEQRPQQDPTPSPKAMHKILPTTHIQGYSGHTPMLREAFGKSTTRLIEETLGSSENAIMYNYSPQPISPKSGANSSASSSSSSSSSASCSPATSPSNSKNKLSVNLQQTYEQPRVINSLVLPSMRTSASPPKRSSQSAILVSKSISPASTISGYAGHQALTLNLRN